LLVERIIPFVEQIFFIKLQRAQKGIDQAIDLLGEYIFRGASQNER